MAFVWLATILAVPGQAATARWWKGNLHTHSFWSDGDDFPEMIAAWYKTNGYQFLALSDHNVVQEGQKWITVTNASRRAAVAKCEALFGRRWLDRREAKGGEQVRLKTLRQIRRKLAVKGEFLLVPSEEITAEFKDLPVHLNASNLRELIKPLKGTNVFDVMQRNVDAVLAQRQRTGQPMIIHLNHPNFGWGITVDDLMRVRGERFFEIYNGHPSVRNEGNADRPSTERMWDISLAFRLTRLGLGPMFGLAVDDSHNYQQFATNKSNPGRGWIMVRAPALTAEFLIAALEAGDFYASTGVRLKDVSRTPRGLSLEIDPEPGVSYTTTFIGTLRTFDATRRPGREPEKGSPVVSGQYSTEIGTVLGVMTGTSAAYEFTGDELYIRARVTSSKPKANPYLPGELESAWVQPAILAR